MGKQRGKRQRKKNLQRIGRLIDYEHFKASLRANAWHPFRVPRVRFDIAKVRHRGLAKNTAQITTLLAVVGLWLTRCQFLALTS